MWRKSILSIKWHCNFGEIPSHLWWQNDHQKKEKIDDVSNGFWGVARDVPRRAKPQHFVRALLLADLKHAQWPVKLSHICQRLDFIFPFLRPGRVFCVTKVFFWFVWFQIICFQFSIFNFQFKKCNYSDFEIIDVIGQHVVWCSFWSVNILYVLEIHV
jgi:hypothetical protein